MNINGRRKIAILMLLAVISMNLFPGFTGNNKVVISPMVATAEAADVTIAPGKFGMVVDSKFIADGSEILMTKDTIELGITHASGLVPADATVVWTDYDRSVINVEFSSSTKAIIKAVGPGYAQLGATVSYGGVNYPIYCQIHVPLQVDTTTGVNVSSDDFGMVSNLKYGDGSQNVGFQLKDDDTTGDYTHYLVKLKYVQYATGVTNHTVAASGQVITVSPPSITWSSSDKTVVEVDQNGILTAVGAGYAEITVTTTTTYDSTSDKLTFPVFVAPLGRVSPSKDGRSSNFIFTASGSSFTIDTNASKSSNLEWTIYKGDKIAGDPIKVDKTDLFKMNLSDYSGNATFTNVKAGTYYITARPSDKYEEDNATIKMLQFKVNVPLFIGHNSITMNVNDYYDIMANSNMPIAGWYNYTTDDDNIASVTQLGVITANASGDTTIDMTLKDTDPDSDSFGLATNHSIAVKVLDGIGLNATSATIYTGSKFQLVLSASNNAAPITWRSSNENVAIVDENGLVIGKNIGDCVITVEQTINGVTKKLTCKIKVKQTVTKITLDPTTKNIAIGDFLTINAKIEPKLNSVSLHWVSSDITVAEVSDAGALSATIKGIGGGVAVISAINQDNVIVGSCLIRVHQPIETIVLSETNVTVPLSDKWFQLYASIEPYAAKDQELVWKSTDPSIITVDNNGKVTFVKSGKASIIVSSKANASINAICNVTVTKSVTGISLDNVSKDMYVGETFRLTYQVKPVDSSNVAVTWTSSNSSVATVDKTGLVSARSVGTAVILLKTTDGGFVATCTIKVSRTATAVKLDITALTMNVGDYYYLETTLTPADSTETTLSWESSDKKVATVSKTGKVIAKGAGKAIIMVKTKSGSVGYCNVTVLQEVTGIEISSKEETISVGDEFELQATVLPESASDQTVTWESSNSSVATVNERGEVKGVGGGTAMISVTSGDGNYKDYCLVTVEELIVNITLNKTYYRLGLGRTFVLVPKVNGEKATNKSLEWTSSNKAIVTVDKNGRIKGKKLGTAVITVAATDGSGAEAYCTVRVSRLVTGIGLSTSHITLVQGKSYKLKATTSPSNATYKVPTYSSDKKDIAIVNSDGTITGLKPGSAIITVKAKDSSGVKAICVVDVIAPIATTGISISESEVVMSPGETKTVSFTRIPSNSTDTFTWSSDNALVASVNAKTGIITAKEMGTANITIMSESGRRGTIKVFVVGLSRTELVLEMYSSTPKDDPLVVEGNDKLKVRWSSANQQIATVSNGTVTGRATGTTYVYAIVNGRKLACKVTVVKIGKGY